MTNPPEKRRIRFPVRLVDAEWEFVLGGRIPITDGSTAELLVDRQDINDPDFLKIMERRAAYRILDQGTPLFVGIVTKPDVEVRADLRPFLVPLQEMWRDFAPGFLDSWATSSPSFVQISLGDASVQQQRRLNATTGGLWLTTKGFDAVGIVSSRINLPPPVSDRAVASLNHAFTRLSEACETWRISHTGSIYARIFYRERNGLLYPLEVLRNEALARQEDGIAKDLWADLMQKMTRPPETQPR